MIKYLIGDATNPKGSGQKIIAHVCNDVGGWGAGFVVAISKKWKAPEKEYRKLFKNKSSIDRGSTAFVKVADDIFVANMIAQKGIGGGLRASEDIDRTDYMALEKCLCDVAIYASDISASIHMPRICCGLCGSTWDKIEPILNKCLKDMDVYVYDFK